MPTISLRWARTTFTTFLEYTYSFRLSEYLAMNRSALLTLLDFIHFGEFALRAKRISLYCANA